MVFSPQTTNVIRYTALGVGILYGFVHQNRIHTRAKLRQAENEYHRKENLITQAKAEWAKRNLPADHKTASGGLITDPNDSRFDMEAYLKHLAADDKKARA